MSWTAACGSAVWVVGLSLVLSALSHAHWLAGTRRLRFRVALGAPFCRIACDLGVVLVGAGLSLVAGSIGLRTCWALVALLGVVLALRRRQVPGRDGVS